MAETGRYGVLFHARHGIAQAFCGRVGIIHYDAWWLRGASQSCAKRGLPQTRAGGGVLRLWGRSGGCRGLTRWLQGGTSSRDGAT
jgi:hypothetical protein